MHSALLSSINIAVRRLMQKNSKSSFRKLLEPVSVTGVPSNEVQYFDQNVILILAVLLCAIISVMGLASMLRCALRWHRREGALEPSGHVTVRLASAGMKKAAIRALPTVVYSKGSEPAEGQAPDCPICLAEFVAGETVRVLPMCNHNFHVDCIDTWLLSNTSCPSCRHSLLNDQTTAEGAPPCSSDLGGSWVVVVRQPGATAGTDASGHVDKSSESFQGSSHDGVHRFLP